MEGTSISLINAETKVKVSSTLDKSVGKKYLMDGSPETCWTSQQGTPQHIQFNFPSLVIPKQVSITFQGGFVGTRCVVEVPEDPAIVQSGWKTFTELFPEDVNRKQTFDLTPVVPVQGIQALRLVFQESSDFFGRITVYDVQITGSVLS
ncbi:hypothetical protein IEO21_02277 [Rhodonia placenta]|uniref:Uncharacterized protein n=1 Tax=Rhodonia placenta TaxID=104341 RepID=A0A8H7U593_9APHY|nr:hypothetical protein IEO21_02277 [Postia placenta]